MILYGKKQQRIEKFGKYIPVDFSVVFSFISNVFIRIYDHANKMSLVMRKPAFCICENKDADQLCGNREADQGLCFRYTYSTIPLLPKSVISSLKPSSVAVQPGLSGTWSETPKTGFLTTRLRCFYISVHKVRLLCLSITLISSLVL